MYRYYLTQRPPMPGAFPAGATKVVDFDRQRTVMSSVFTEKQVHPFKAWGFVEYENALPASKVWDYELREQGPFYVSRETGEMLSRQAMLHQWRELYDGGDPTNPLGWEEYYEEVDE